MKKKREKASTKNDIRSEQKKVRNLVKTWDDSFYVRCYQYAKSGKANPEIAFAIGVSPKRFTKWLKTNLVLFKAVQEGREMANTKIAKTYQNYVYQSLSKKLKAVWDEIVVYLEANATNRIERLLKDKGDRERQSLFVHALVSFNFNPSRAMKATSTSMKKLNEWKTDPDFAELLMEIDAHKKNFIEGAIMDGIERGEMSAVMFAAKNLMSETYGDKSTKIVKHEGTVTNKHTISVSELEGLPLEDRKRILETIRANREQAKLPPRTAQAVVGDSPEGK